MPNRILKESINESRSLSEVSFFAEDLYKRLITYADDYGRFNADYQIILARLYPREIQIVKESDIEDALIELSGAGKIAFYTARPRKEIYGCFPNWSQHQRVRESKGKFPEPNDTEINDWYLRRFIPMKLKKHIIERDGFKCKLCGKYVATVQDSGYLIKMAAGLFHIDHIVPVVQGGRATEENLRLTCPKCNLSRKRNYSMEEIMSMTLQEKESCCGDLPQVAAKICRNPIQSESLSETIPRAETNRFQEFAAAYPKAGADSYAVGVEYINTLRMDISEDDLIQAAKNYAEACQINGTQEQFLLNAENFLKKLRFDAYLPGKYKKPEPKRKSATEQYGEFMKNDYDFDSLEKQLLGGG